MSIAQGTELPSSILPCLSVQRLSRFFYRATPVNLPVFREERIELREFVRDLATDINLQTLSVRLKSRYLWPEVFPIFNARQMKYIEEERK